MNDAEWFHFDTLWENWAPPSGASSAGPVGASSLLVATDPTLIPQPTFGSGDPGGPSSGFAGGPPEMVAHAGGDGRFNNAGAVGAMQQVPMYPITRFNE